MLIALHKNDPATPAIREAIQKATDTESHNRAVCPALSPMAQMRMGGSWCRTWQEAFALAMRDEGVGDEASPRPLRGIMRRAERSVV